MAASEASTGQGSPRILLEALPPGVLVDVMRSVGFPWRHAAAVACRRFRDAVRADDTRVHRVRPHEESISAACARAAPGDTVMIPPGYYKETVIVAKPLRIVGARVDDVFGGSRPGVVVEGRCGVAIDAEGTSRVALEDLVLRASCSCGRAWEHLCHRSCVAFGPATASARLDRCEVRGATGLILPAAAGPDARLTCVGCKMHGVGYGWPTTFDGWDAASGHGRHHLMMGHQTPPMASAAVHVETGTCHLRGCVVTDNRGFGIIVNSRGRAVVEHCDVSFNTESGLWMRGEGRIVNNVIWGNRRHAIFKDRYLEEDEDTRYVANHVRLAPREAGSDAGTGNASVVGDDALMLATTSGSSDPGSDGGGETDRFSDFEEGLGVAGVGGAVAPRGRSGRRNTLWRTTTARMNESFAEVDEGHEGHKAATMQAAFAAAEATTDDGGAGDVDTDHSV